MTVPPAAASRHMPKISMKLPMPPCLVSVAISVSSAVAAAKDWLKLGAAEFYKKYGFRFQPRGSTLAEATRQMGQ